MGGRDFPCLTSRLRQDLFSLRRVRGSGSIAHGTALQPPPLQLTLVGFSIPMFPPTLETASTFSFRFLESSRLVLLPSPGVTLSHQQWVGQRPRVSITRAP